MSTPKQKIQTLYSEVTQCPLACAGIRNDQKNGVIPRSFYIRSAPRNIEVLIVGKNPGHAPAWESEIVAATNPRDRAQRHLELVAELFEGKRSVGTSFHANLIRRVAGILGVESTFKAVFSKSALTTLVKCESIGDKTKSLPAATRNTCAYRYLLNEIEILRPIYLIALGGEAYNYLTSRKFAAEHGLPVGNLYHPSWSNMPGGEDTYLRTEIPKLRTQYLRAKKST